MDELGCSAAPPPTFRDYVVGLDAPPPHDEYQYAQVTDPGAEICAERLAARQERLLAASPPPAAAILDACDAGRVFSDIAYYYGQFGIMDDRKATYTRFADQVLLPSARALAAPPRQAGAGAGTSDQPAAAENRK